METELSNQIMILRSAFRRLPFAFVVVAWVGFSSYAKADFDFDIGSNHYRVLTTNQIWINAATVASNTSFNDVVGGLARVDDASENAAIFAALQANIPCADFSETIAPDGGGGAYVWLGGSDRGAEGIWIWDLNNDGNGDQFWSGDENGSAVGGLFNNFGTTSSNQNEPDNFGAGQDGLAISLNGWPLGFAAQWNDVNDGNDLYFIIEFENANPDCVLGDVNQDEQINLLDVSPFVALIGSGGFMCEADINQDGSVDLLDVAPFVALLSGN